MTKNFEQCRKSLFFQNFKALTCQKKKKNTCTCVEVWNILHVHFPAKNTTEEPSYVQKKKTIFVIYRGCLKS